MSGYGLHKASGGFRARWREAFKRLPEMTCPLKLINPEAGYSRPCGEPAAGFVETVFGEPRPICAKHIPRARELGYPVYTHDPYEPGDQPEGR